MSETTSYRLNRGTGVTIDRNDLYVRHVDRSVTRVDGRGADGESFRQMVHDDDFRADSPSSKANALVAYLADTGTLVAKDRGTRTSVRTLRVGVVATGDRALADAVTAALQRAESEQVTVAFSEREGAEILVVADAGYDRQALLAENVRLLADGQPALIVSVTGDRYRIGPFVRPHVTACEACLQHRVDACSIDPGFHESFRHVLKFEDPDRDVVAMTASLALSQARAYALDDLDSCCFGQVVRGEFSALLQERHALLRHPFCDACGVASRIHDVRSNRVDL